MSGFGSTGPLRPTTGRATSSRARSARGPRRAGLPDREPLQAGGQLTETVTGAYAAAATLGAIEGRARHGNGDHVDVSVWESAITCAMGPTIDLPVVGGTSTTRHSDFMTGPSFNIRCRDGFVGVNALTEVQWQTACLFAGRPDMADDQRFGDFFGRLAYVDEIREVFESAFG